LEKLHLNINCLSVFGAAAVDSVTAPLHIGRPFKGL